MFIERVLGSSQSVKYSTTEGLTITTGKAAKDPVNLGEMNSGAIRLRQHAIDYEERPDDDGYLEVYLNKFIKLDTMFNWTAINMYDIKFRLSKASTRPNTITSWRDPAIELYHECFTMNPGAAKSTGGNPAKPGPKKPGPKKPGAKTLGHAAWGRKYLSVTEHNGTAICFMKQRTGSCNRRGCNFEHDICGMCGTAGHVAKDCPNGPPPQN